MVLLSILLNMEMDNNNLQMEILIKESIKIIDLMDLVHIAGEMDKIYIKDILKMV